MSETTRAFLCGIKSFIFDVLTISCVVNRSLASATRFRQSTQDQLVGPLRLATKYDMEELRREIISALVVEWPTTLEEWDLNEESIKTQFTSIEDQGEYWEMYHNRDFPSWTPDPSKNMSLSSVSYNRY